MDDPDQSQGDVPAGVDTSAEPEQPEPDAGIPTQQDFDLIALRQGLTQTRQELAIGKANWHVANLTGIKGHHPGTIAEECRRLARQAELLQDLLARRELPMPQAKVLHLEPPSPEEVRRILETPDGS